ncbi:MAG: radical SAM protein [Methanoculleaceae archaeon]
MLSRGCIQCRKGAAMVLFITGRCNRYCWYCPLSAERKGRDVIYANERRLSSPEEAVEVARTMDALATGITGGEPLMVVDRVVTYAGRIREEFGADHHIHLYTGAIPTGSDLERLSGVVDELRFHPPHESWGRIMESPYPAAVESAREHGFVVGIEVPALPGMEFLRPILPMLDFMNIDELEWGESCSEEMRRRGLEPVDDLHNAVRGSREWAEPLLDEPKVHWCSSAYKDSVQLRRRLQRIARRTARPFDEITGDGTVVYGVWRPAPGAQVPTHWDAEDFEECGDHIELDREILCTEADSLPGEKYVVERYPDRGIIVEVYPL